MRARRQQFFNILPNLNFRPKVSFSSVWSAMLTHSWLLHKLTTRKHSDNRLYRFNAHFADYAAYLSNILKEFRNTSLIQSQPWTIVIKVINKKKVDLIAWIVSDQNSSRSHCLYLEALKRFVEQLVREGETAVNLNLLLIAIRFYARRNFICHGRLSDLFKSDNFCRRHSRFIKFFSSTQKNSGSNTTRGTLPSCKFRETYPHHIQDHKPLWPVHWC